VGLNLDRFIADSERDVPRTREGEQLKRYRAALPNLLYTDGLEWHWFVNGEPRLDAPVSLGTWNKSSKKLKPATWEMHIGGYQPLEKWLKDRKGRTLEFDDVRHYLRVVIALRETRRLMGEIDGLIPGWPLE
jgi:hypothetical protein